MGSNICPKCQADLTKVGLIEKLSDAFVETHYKVNKQNKIVEMLNTEIKDFSENMGFFCPKCDAHIDDLLDWA